MTLDYHAAKEAVSDTNRVVRQLSWKRFIIVCVIAVYALSVAAFVGYSAFHDTSAELARLTLKIEQQFHDIEQQSQKIGKQDNTIAELRKNVADLEKELAAEARARLDSETKTSDSILKLSRENATYKKDLLEILRAASQSQPTNPAFGPTSQRNIVPPELQKLTPPAPEPAPQSEPSCLSLGYFKICPNNQFKTGE